MYWTCAKFVPRLLTNDQKEMDVNISQELLDRANVDSSFLKNIITGDETWVYGYDVKTKRQSSQWVGKGSPRPKIPMSQSNIRWCWSFLWLERRSPLWICSMWSNSEQGVLYGSFKAFEGCCAQEEAWAVEKPELDVAPRQRTSSHVTPYLQFSGKTQDNRPAPTTLLSRLGPNSLFLISHVKGNLERTSFSNHG